jgi:hypothetical protein
MKPGLAIGPTVDSIRATRAQSAIAAAASSAVLLLAACGPSPLAHGYVEVTQTGGQDKPSCTDWNDYDDDWHRCHQDEPGIVWCNAPDASAGSYALPDAGASAAASVDGSGGTVTDGATSSSDSVASGETGATGDAGAADGGSSGQAGPVNPCTVSATCAAGSSCVMGSCRPCSGGICICQRDDECPANQICDHSAGTCSQPPPSCSALTTEGECIARANCIPIYGGMSCTNNLGNACQSGEANCTCATYSFATCVARGM